MRILIVLTSSRAAPRADAAAAPVADPAAAGRSAVSASDPTIAEYAQLPDDPGRRSRPRSGPDRAAATERNPTAASSGRPRAAGTAAIGERAAGRGGPGLGSGGVRLSGLRRRG